MRMMVHTYYPSMGGEGVKREHWEFQINLCSISRSGNKKLVANKNSSLPCVRVRMNVSLYRKGIF